MMPQLRRMAVKLCRDSAAADDLVQDTLLRALNHREQFATGTNLAAWLTTIMKNTRLSRIRRGWREVEDVDGLFAESVPIEDSPLKKMEVRELLVLVDRLPPIWREPLRLLADGASYEEVALEIGEHIGTVKSRVHRARMMLGLC